MLREISKYMAIVACLVSSFSFTACKNDDDDIDNEISIYYTDKLQTVDDDVTSTDIRFTAYSSWYLSIDESDSSWMSTDAASGVAGSYTLKCLMKKNTTYEQRTGVIYFHGETQSTYATINQRGMVNIEFKDPIFEQYCLENFDTDSSGYVTRAEAHLAKKVLCPNMGIADFTGIEYFKNITEIDVNGNLMERLSIAECSALTKVTCNNCPNLAGLELGEKLKSVKTINCNDCAIENIVLDSCIVLYEFYCRNNQLKNLDITNNTELKKLDCTGNLNMTTIFINKDHKFEDLKKEESTQFVYPDQEIYMPDEEFRNYIITEYDSNRDKKISADEAQEVLYIHCCGKIGNPRNIHSLQGIEYFPNVSELDCSYCMIEEIDLTYNSKLKYIYCEGNEDLKSLKISSLSPLSKINCEYCSSLTNLDMNRNTHVIELVADNCAISSLNLTMCSALRTIDISHNKLESLEITENKYLTCIDCSHNLIAGTLTIKNCDSLAYVFCNNNRIEAFDFDRGDLYDVDCSSNQLTGEISLAECENLHTFACDSNELTSIKLPKAKNFIRLTADANKLETIDLTDQSNLQYAYLRNNQLSDVKVTGCKVLERLLLTDNHLSGELSFSDNRELKVIWLENNNIETVWLPKGTEQLEYKVDQGVEVKFR